MYNQSVFATEIYDSINKYPLLVKNLSSKSFVLLMFKDPVLHNSSSLIHEFLVSENEIGYYESSDKRQLKHNKP